MEYLFFKDTFNLINRPRVQPSLFYVPYSSSSIFLFFLSYSVASVLFQAYRPQKTLSFGPFSLKWLQNGSNVHVQVYPVFAVCAVLGLFLLT